ncbi:MAG: phosphoenolpyruvate carboxykinase (ATP) [Bacteroidetes bacterium]|nr:phosphoenolpyruvate carboxykinase (ATP) [Bacteroidota bacterium]
MNNLLNIKTPAQNEATALKSDYGLENHGITNLRMAYWNLPTEALYEEIAFRNEARITKLGPIVANTGKHTARSANDKYIVKEPSTENHVWWGEYNRPFSSDKFDGLYNRMLGFMQGRDLFVQDCYVGADTDFKMPIRIVTEKAWHALFARNMFILPETNEEYRRHIPDFTVVALPSFKGIPQIDGTASETFIVLNFAKRLCIIGNSAYAGEIKKSVFTILNYLLPLQGVMSMHSSANIGKDGDTAIFFGLSGTGKTTLSADPKRRLIGDDEHGWSDDGVFNYEGGCYAKVIRLSASAEPQIHATTKMFGTILENVVFDPVTRMIDLDDESITENTRASYPLNYIENAVPEKKGDHPKNIILLTCDASGVMPPISKLSPDQAIYQFISGYTSKIAGTEVGLGKEPELTFSTCFGAPFMVHHPYFYADILKRKIINHNVNCWLVNTGWIGGAFGVGKRISIGYTRALLNAALNDELQKVNFMTDPIFGFQVPTTCDGVPSNILDPSTSWPSKEEYMSKYKQLASRFVENFKKYEAGCPPELIKAGPKV